MIVKLFFLYGAALLLDHFGPGKKICEESTIGVILMGSQFCEYILQIIINPETVGFGGLHQTVHDGTGLGTTDESTLTQFLRPTVKGRMARSAVLLSMGTSLLSRKTRRYVS